MHVPYETFWHLNPRKLKPFEKAYEMEMESRQARMNLEAWVFGLYNQHAVASILSKGARYPSKPIELFGKSKKTPEAEVEEFRRFMLQHNAQKRIKAEVRDK